MEPTATYTGFGGQAGLVARNAFRPSNAINGFLLFLPLFALAFAFGLAGAPLVGQIAGQAVIALFLARAAAAGLRGETRGIVLSSEAGSWSEAGGIALRFLALTAVWLVPLLMIGSAGSRPDAAMQAAMMQGGGGMAPSPLAMMPALGPAMGVTAAFLFLTWLAPPVFLVVSTSAGTFGEAFSPAHWRSQLAGRGGDLLVLYVVYAGVLAMTFVFTLPLMLLAAAAGWRLALLVGAGVGLFALGMVVDLLGRLAGFFVVEGFAPGAPEQVAGAGDDPDGVTPVDDGPPPIDDVEGHLARAEETRTTDPDAAIAALLDLQRDHAPEPRVLYTAWRWLVERERKDEALELAVEAAPVLVDHDHHAHAARMLRVHWDAKDRLTGDRDRTLAMAQAMARDGDTRFAANTYALVLAADKRDPRAIKGILGIAKRLHERDGRTDDAVRLYRYLLATAPESPLAEYARTGLAEATEGQGSAKAV